MEESRIDEWDKEDELETLMINCRKRFSGWEFLKGGIVMSCLKHE